MGTISKNFGNMVGLVIMATDGTFPTTLTAWNNTTGNCIKLVSEAQGKTKSPLDVTEKEFKTNDDVMYDTTEERKYSYAANLYERGKSYTTWVQIALLAAKAAGQKVLFIGNLGYIAGDGYKEVFAIGTQRSSLKDEDNVEDAMDFMFTSTPPPAGSVTLTTTNIGAINTAIGAGSVKVTTAVVVLGGLGATAANYYWT